ncbi:MAG: NAD-dependent epimerase/dehydratase family protein [Frankiaceae bacterium]
MRVLVTGAAGFIGSNVCDRLIADGHTVFGVDDLSRGTLSNIEDAARGGSFDFERFDVTDPGFPALVARVAPESMCHLAAQIDVRVSVADPLLDARLNLLGTINTLEAARLAGVDKFVFTSSGGSIYGTPAALPVDESQPLSPESQYAAGKAACELYLNVYRAAYGLRSSSLALANVYGPRQDPHGEAGVVAIFSTAMLLGRPTRIYGDGSQIRDYVFVGDVADAFTRVCVPGAGDGKRFNIGTGSQTSVCDLHSLIAETVGVPDEPLFAPPRLGELQAIALDWSLAARELGWRPRRVLREGIVETVDWIRSRLAI